jgi:hypothetical protein
MHHYSKPIQRGPYYTEILLSVHLKISWHNHYIIDLWIVPWYPECSVSYHILPYFLSSMFFYEFSLCIQLFYFCFFELEKDGMSEYCKPAFSLSVFDDFFTYSDIEATEVIISNPYNEKKSSIHRLGS